MFAELKPPRKAPEKLMHVCDAGGCCDEDGSGAMVRMQCKRCGHETGWLYLATVTEAKRGKPCPVCNATPNVEVTGAARLHRAASVLTAGLCPGDDNGE
jgi:hypothetical protein